MNIGIMVYSRSGHTLSVAEKLRDRLAGDGHAVRLEEVKAPPGPPQPGRTDVPLETVPQIDAYDALVIGCPVWGGIPASPMAAYLEQLPTLAGKQVLCLATGVFPAGWGRNQCLARLEAICEHKGAAVVGSGSVGWLSLRRGRQIARVVADLSAAFQAPTRDA